MRSMLDVSMPSSCAGDRVPASPAGFKRSLYWVVSTWRTRCRRSWPLLATSHGNRVCFSFPCTYMLSLILCTLVARSQGQCRMLASSSRQHAAGPLSCYLSLLSRTNQMRTLLSRRLR